MPEREFRDPQERTYGDFQVGDVIYTRGRTIDASDLTAFAGLTGDYYPMHIDAEHAAGTRFKSRIAHGPLTYAVAVGLVGMTGYYGNGIVALLEVQQLRALKPVLPGDTISVRAEVTARHADDSSRHGTVNVAYSVSNQRKEEVMQFTHVMLARRRQDIEDTDG